MDKALVSGRRALARLQNLDKIVESDNVDQILASFDMATQCYEQCSEIINKCLIDEEEEGLLTQLTELQLETDTIYFRMKTKHSKAKRSIEVSTPTPSSIVNNGASHQQNIKLAPINLVKFDGDLKSWATFRDLFEVSVNSNGLYSNIEKFHILITHLSNEPLSIVKSLPINDANYPIAYESLIARYDNKRLLANSYWQNICNTKKASGESSQSLRLLVTTFSENLAALNKIKESVGDSFDLWDFTLFNWLLQKLDSQTRTRFELENSSVEFPTFNLLKSFIEGQCKAIEVNPTTSTTQNSKAPPINKSKSTHSMRGPTHNFVVKTGAPGTFDCPECKTRHQIEHCAKFLEKTPQDRYAFVREHKICLNCLKGMHWVKNCPSKNTCRHCGAKHHTLLHFEVASTSSTASASINSQNDGS